MLVLPLPPPNSARDTSPPICLQLLCSPTRFSDCFQRGVAPGRRPEVRTWPEHGFSYSTMLVLPLPPPNSARDTSPPICLQLLCSPTRFLGCFQRGVAPGWRPEVETWPKHGFSYATMLVLPLPPPNSARDTSPPICLQLLCSPTSFFGCFQRGVAPGRRPEVGTWPEHGFFYSTMLVLPLPPPNSARDTSPPICLQLLCSPTRFLGCFQRGVAPGRRPEAGTWPEHGFFYSTILVLPLPPPNSARDTSPPICLQLLCSPTRFSDCFQRGVAPGRRPEVRTWPEHGFSYSTMLVLPLPPPNSARDTSPPICLQLLCSPTRFLGCFQRGVAPGWRPDVETWPKHGFSYATMLVLPLPPPNSARDTSPPICLQLLCSPTSFFGCFQRGVAPGRRPEVGTWPEHGFFYSTMLVLPLPPPNSARDTSPPICLQLLCSPTRFLGCFQRGVAPGRRPEAGTWPEHGFFYSTILVLPLPPPNSARDTSPPICLQLLWMVTIWLQKSRKHALQ